MAGACATTFLPLHFSTVRECMTKTKRLILLICVMFAMTVVSDMRGPQDWVVRVQGNGVNFELLSYQEPLSQVYLTPYLYFQMPIVPPGVYSVTAYPLIDPGITSNTIQLTIQ